MLDLQIEFNHAITKAAFACITSYEHHGIADADITKFNFVSTIHGAFGGSRLEIEDRINAEIEELI